MSALIAWVAEQRHSQVEDCIFADVIVAFQTHISADPLPCTDCYGMHGWGLGGQRETIYY